MPDVQRSPEERKSNERTGHAIADLRTDLEVTRKDLAEKLGISPALLGKYENGNVSVPHEMLERIAENLRCTITDITLRTMSERDVGHSKMVSRMTGRKIQGIRTEKQMSEEDFAGSVGISAEALRRYEAGVIVVPAKVLMEISSIYNIGIADLFPPRSHGDSGV